jgi:hypothetical protein
MNNKRKKKKERKNRSLCDGHMPVILALRRQTKEDSMFEAWVT